MTSNRNAIVIGAGPAGLAVAACLKQRGVELILLEKGDGVGTSWRQHYDRLHLHTDRAHSGLPGLPMPRTYPRYPGRAQVVDYLERYADHFGLAPRFDTEAIRARREAGGWRVDTNGGTIRAAALVVATGTAGSPVQPDWPGRESFGGDIRHSVAYRNPAAYAGKRVLVAGLGNSGGEIALDLANAGTAVAVAVRGPVNIVPRQLFGVPILTWAIILSRLPPGIADLLAAPLIGLGIGSLARFGISRPVEGAIASVRLRGRVPLIDIGTVAAVRDGRIAIRPDVRRVYPGAVEFADGRREAYDAIIAATGFRPDLREFLPEAPEALDAAGSPLVSGARSPVSGLYFCGFHVSPTGQLREIGREAQGIAADVAASVRSPAE